MKKKNIQFPYFELILMIGLMFALEYGFFDRTIESTSTQKNANVISQLFN